jgi:hypothetical protein
MRIFTYRLSEREPLAEENFNFEDGETGLQNAL